MGIDYRCGINTEQWKADLLARAKEKLSREMQVAATQIKIRTQAGTDAEGASFKPYSKAYAAYRLAHGRQADHVDLLYTGAMQKAIHTKIEDANNAIDGVIYVTAEEAEKVRENEKRGRKFFALAKEQLGALVESFRNTKLIG